MEHSLWPQNLGHSWIWMCSGRLTHRPSKLWPQELLFPPFFLHRLERSWLAVFPLSPSFPLFVICPGAWLCGRNSGRTGDGVTVATGQAGLLGRGPAHLAVSPPRIPYGVHRMPEPDGSPKCKWTVRLPCKDFDFPEGASLRQPTKVLYYSLWFAIAPYTKNLRKSPKCL